MTRTKISHYVCTLAMAALVAAGGACHKGHTEPKPPAPAPSPAPTPAPSPTPAPTPKPPTPLQKCDDQPSGTQQTRLRYKHTIGTIANLCAPEEQVRTCNDGVWSPWSGDAIFAQDHCQDFLHAGLGLNIDSSKIDPNNVVIYQKHLYALNIKDGILPVDISDPFNPQPEATIPIDTTGKSSPEHRKLLLIDNNLYVFTDYIYTKTIHHDDGTTTDVLKNGALITIFSLDKTLSKINTLNSDLPLAEQEWVQYGNHLFSMDIQDRVLVTMDTFQVPNMEIKTYTIEPNSETHKHTYLNKIALKDHYLILLQTTPGQAGVNVEVVDVQGIGSSPTLNLATKPFTLPNINTPVNIEVVGDYAYILGIEENIPDLAKHTGWVHLKLLTFNVTNISNPLPPQLVAVHDLPNIQNPLNLKVSDNFAYLQNKIPLASNTIPVPADVNKTTLQLAEIDLAAPQDPVILTPVNFVSEQPGEFFMPLASFKDRIYLVKYTHTTDNQDKVSIVPFLP